MKLLGFICGVVLIALIVGSIIPNPTWSVGISLVIGAIWGYFYTKYIWFRRPYR